MSNIDVKENILNSAKEIALKQGITKINIRAVAKNSGIAIGSVYNYYPKKDDLLMAVIEDFWTEALSEIDFRNLDGNSFFEKIQKIYDSMYVYFHKFKENWLEQLSLLNEQEKRLGRKKQNEYFSRIYAMIVYLMDEDDNIRSCEWNSLISKERTAEFIFDNMIVLFKKDESNPEILIEVLKKIMTN